MLAQDVPHVRLHFCLYSCLQQLGVPGISHGMFIFISIIYTISSAGGRTTRKQTGAGYRACPSIFAATTVM
eukprot:scaffold2997_cov182-Amphora_coffeaeformis.AAC.12